MSKQTTTNSTQQADAITAALKYLRDRIASTEAFRAEMLSKGLHAEAEIRYVVARELRAARALIERASGRPASED